MAHWIKLQYRLIDNPRMGKLPNRVWRRCIELVLLAHKEYYEYPEDYIDGRLPDIGYMAWKLRTTKNELLEDLKILKTAGLVDGKSIPDPQNGWAYTADEILTIDWAKSGWHVVDFEQRWLGYDYPRMPYKQYLATKHWKKRRARALDLANYKCQKCGISSKSAKLHVHHLSYDNLGKESDDELMVLCSSCHRKVHNGAG
jgi:hypothetical protein